MWLNLTDVDMERVAINLDRVFWFHPGGENGGTILLFPFEDPRECGSLMHIEVKEDYEKIAGAIGDMLDLREDVEGPKGPAGEPERDTLSGTAGIASCGQ